MSASYFFYIILLWITYILVSLAITLSFDRQRIRACFFQGVKAYLVRLASQIPPKRPGLNQKWLPLEMKSRYEPKRFIEVPIFVKY